MAYNAIIWSMQCSLFPEKFNLGRVPTVIPIETVLENTRGIYCLSVTGTVEPWCHFRSIGTQSIVEETEM